MSPSLLKRALLSHPANPPPPGLRVAVQRLSPDDPTRPLSLRFELLGELAAIRLPDLLPVGAIARADRLWQHTCFEAFVAAPAAAPDGGPYVEFNFAPSGAWAAYRFEAYRDGMRAEPVMVEPRIVASRSDNALVVDVALAWPAPLPATAGATGRPALRDARGWQGRLGLTAVVEAADGSLSYWALRHPAARADFHNDQGFTVGVEVPE